MDNKLKKIQELLAIKNSLKPLSQGELERLREDFIIDSTYNSNAIEGNPLTLKETTLILKQGITISEKPLDAHLEAIGYKDAFNFIYEISTQNEPLTESVIKQIHSLVLMHDNVNKGIYRKLPVSVGEHKPPEPYLVPKLMEDLILNYKPKDITDLAKLHLDFETIHPFIDGNGRTGRLILNLELIKMGLLPINIKFADQNKYYDAFESVDLMNNLVADYEIGELERFISIVNGGQN